ncbi:MAG: hypothetical protein QM606_06910 [Leucobacter sp.]
MLLGCSEFAWPALRIAGEYEGTHHRIDQQQWNRDIEKYHAYSAHGWESVRVTAQLLYAAPRDLRARFAETFRSRGWTPPP